MRYPLVTLSVLFTVGLSACAGYSSIRYAGLVVPVDATEVTPCAFLDEVSSTSGLTGFFAPKGIDNIKQNLLRQADALGATHIVWGEPVVGYDTTTLKARAYNCQAPQRAK
jgi:hypothetical protein